MKFNKCFRCGCFFTSNNDVCPSCISKDEIDKNTLKNYLDNTDTSISLTNLASQSGVDLKNINRYLQTEEFADYKKLFSNDDFDHIKISL